MTLPMEEKVAINNTRLFLLKLMYSELSPGVPNAVRKQAGTCLRHYPAAYQIDTIFKHYFNSDDIHCPKYFLDRYHELADDYRTLEVRCVWNEIDRITRESRKHKAFGKLNKKKVRKAVKNSKRRKK